MSDALDEVMTHGPLQVRNATVDDVNYKQRIITILAAPYDVPALVEYRGAIWKEIFERGAFAGAQESPHRVRANREHDRNRTVGKVIGFPERSMNGLVTDVKIAKTLLGDETLALADEDCIGASVGYAVVGDGERLEKRTMTRYVTDAFLHHLSFVEQPAFKEATVLAVRNEDESLPAMKPEGKTLVDPTFDEILKLQNWMASRNS